MFDYLIGKEYQGTIITAELLNKAISCRLKKLRSKLKRDKHPDKTLSDKQLLAKYLHEEDIKKSINSVICLIPPDKNPAVQEAQLKRKTSFKYEDVRNVDLSENPYTGYTPSEISFIENGMKKKSEDFDLKTDSDRFLAWRTVICELKIKQLEVVMLTQSPKDFIETQKQIDMLDKQYRSFLDSLNGLKKQRDNQKVTVTENESDDWINAIKSLDELQLEAKQQKEEIAKQMNNRKRD